MKRRRKQGWKRGKEMLLIGGIFLAFLLEGGILLAFLLVGGISLFFYWTGEYSLLSYWLAEKLGNDQPTNSMADVSKLLSSKLLRRKSLIMLNEKMTIFLPHQLKRFFFLSWPYIVMAAVAWLHNDQVASSLQKARAGHETPQRLYSNISPGGEVHILASGVL